MQVGCLGNVVFEVSDSVVRTLSNAVWSGSATYSVHQRHNGAALTEYTGLDPDKFAFDIQLSTALGVDPMSELVKIWRYMRNGECLKLSIGSKAYGRYRWNITSLKINLEQTDPAGNLTGATVSVELQEYLAQ